MPANISMYQNILKGTKQMRENLSFLLHSRFLFPYLSSIYYFKTFYASRVKISRCLRHRM